MLVESTSYLDEAREYLDGREDVTSLNYDPGIHTKGRLSFELDGEAYQVEETHDPGRVVVLDGDKSKIQSIFTDLDIAAEGYGNRIGKGRGQAV